MAHMQQGLKSSLGLFVDAVLVQGSYEKLIAVDTQQQPRVIDQ